jgi:hypothetical protein
MTRVLVLVLCAGLCACAKKETVEVKDPSHLPITEQAKELTTLPLYQKPTETGTVQGVSKGDVVPFDGILLSEDKAMSAANLRISYDELYRLAESDRKYLMTVVEIQEKTLQLGDQRIRRLEGELSEIRNSWWNNNKMEVGIVVGVVLGIAVTAGTGAIWVKIKE